MPRENSLFYPLAIAAAAAIVISVLMANFLITQHLENIPKGVLVLDFDTVAASMAVGTPAEEIEQKFDALLQQAQIYADDGYIILNERAVVVTSENQRLTNVQDFAH